MKIKIKIVVIAIIIVVIGLLSIFLILIKPTIHSQKEYTAADFGITDRMSSTDADSDGLDDYTDIMLGAREYIALKPLYKSKYYDGGYPDDGYGVCTDVVWNAFKSAGYDLKLLVDDDIANNPDSYTTIDKPDPNIDFRRVKNLKIFFDRNAISLSKDFSDSGEWQPGDIVVFSNHIAICSDKRNSDGIPFLIHHNIHGAREVNEIENYSVIGHYRWPKNSDNDNAISGEYEFDEIVYLSPLSSSTIDYMEENMKETKYIISKDKFEIASAENSYVDNTANNVKIIMDIYKLK